MTFPTNQKTEKTPVRVTLICGNPKMGRDLRVGNLKFGGEAADLLEIRDVRPAAPDDMPLDIVLTIPRDATMGTDFDDLKAQVAEFPASMGAAGHRMHRLYVYTYSACSDEMQWVGNKAYEMGAEASRELAIALAGVAQEDVTKECRRVDETACSGKAPCFTGREFFDTLDKIRALFSGAKRYRPRLLALLHDARMVDTSRAPADLKPLREAFDHITVIQPDLAPQVFAIRRGRLEGRLINGYVAKVQANAFNRELQMCKAHQTDLTPEQCRERAKMGSEFVAKLLKDMMSKGYFPRPPGAGRGFLSRRQYVENAFGCTGAAACMKGLAATNQDAPRPTGLDCFGLRLEKEQLGRFVVAGGFNPTVACKDTGDERTEDGGDGTLTGAFADRSPFFHGVTIDGLLKPIGGGGGGAGAGGGGGVRVTVTDGNDNPCFNRVLPTDMGADNAPPPDGMMSEQLRRIGDRIVCGGECREPPPPPPPPPLPGWILALGGLLFGFGGAWLLKSGMGNGSGGSPVPRPASPTAYGAAVAGSPAGYGAPQPGYGVPQPGMGAMPQGYIAPQGSPSPYEMSGVVHGLGGGGAPADASRSHYLGGGAPAPLGAPQTQGSACAHPTGMCQTFEACKAAQRCLLRNP